MCSAEYQEEQLQLDQSVGPGGVAGPVGVAEMSEEGDSHQGSDDEEKGATGVKMECPSPSGRGGVSPSLGHMDMCATPTTLASPYAMSIPPTGPD